jgi:DNA-binding CsgD family transcriptional regulator
MKQRGDTNEAIMAFMEIDKNTFQQYLKWIETK